MPQKHIKQILILICLVGVLVMPYFVFAGTAKQVLQNVAEGGAQKDGPYAEITGGTEETKISEIIGTLIQTILSFLGVIFIILILRGGFLWMTAGGEEDQVEDALGIIGSSVTGLVIIVMAYAIWRFVFAAFSPT